MNLGRYEISGNQSAPPTLDVARDLQPAHKDGSWKEIREQAAADPLAQLVLQVREKLEPCVDESVSRIRSRIQAYDDGGIVRHDDLWWSVYRNNEVLLVLLANRRGLIESELQQRQYLGLRRAQQGVPVTDVLAAFRIGYSTFWETLLTTARSLGREVELELTDNAMLLWRTLDETSSGIAAAHRAVTNARDLEIQRRGMSFLDALRRLPTDRMEAEEHARYLDLDPTGPFLVAVVEGHSHEFGVRPGILVEEPDRTLLISQPSGKGAAAEENLVEWLQGRSIKPAGIGVLRDGMMGGKQSLADAELAYSAARTLGEEVVTFRNQWLECLVIESSSALEVLADRAAEMLMSDEDMCTTLRRYFDADGRYSRAGELLHLHPNTVAYRLGQFTKLTGIDPRTTAGGALARVALTLTGIRSGRQ